VVLASTLGQIFKPIFDGFAWLVAEFYALIPNYAVAIGLLTLVTMVVTFPITRRSTRSMMRMQLLSPELKKLQSRYKVPPNATVAEKQDIRQRQNQEMMAFYKENNVSPTGGCLPMLLQIPIFIILYDTIRGLTATKTVIKHGKKLIVPSPDYISHTSKMYHAIIAAHGSLPSFGLNLAASIRSFHSWGARTPYIILIIIAIILQYIQIKQMSGRNVMAQANPQMKQMQSMQKIFPLVYAILYIELPAGVSIYFIVSSLFRVLQQEYMYRHDPHIKESFAKLKLQAEDHAKTKSLVGEDKPKGFRALLEAVSDRSSLASNEVSKTNTSSKGYTPPKGSLQKNKTSNRSSKKRR
jgi:YidC/Oxa1 family membrane protein insertase